MPNRTLLTQTGHFWKLSDFSIIGGIGVVCFLELSGEIAHVGKSARVSNDFDRVARSKQPLSRGPDPFSNYPLLDG